MKIGDLVHDSTYGMNGMIVDQMSLHKVVERWRDAEADNLRVWIILYEDGQTDEAFDSELEMISESR